MRALTSKRVLVVVLLAVGAAVAARVAAPSHGAVRASAALACGIERQAVKSLQDRPRLIPARRTTIAHLASLARPSSVLSARLPFERRIFSITGAVTQVRSEADHDVHLVVQSGSRRMIVEAPDAPFCTGRASPLRKRQMASARKAARPCARAHIVGVAFWDYYHGQIGVSPNAIELHPMLGFQCLSAPPPPPPPPPPRSGRQVRGLVSGRVHPIASAGPRLRGHSLQQLPRAVERAGPGPASLRRRSRRRRLRELGAVCVVAKASRLSCSGKDGSDGTRNPRPPADRPVLPLPL